MQAASGPTVFLRWSRLDGCSPHAGGGGAARNSSRRTWGGVSAPLGRAAAPGFGHDGPASGPLGYAGSMPVDLEERTH